MGHGDSSISIMFSWSVTHFWELVSFVLFKLWPENDILVSQNNIRHCYMYPQFRLHMGNIPKSVYQKWLSDCRSSFMQRSVVCKGEGGAWGFQY